MKNYSLFYFTILLLTLSCSEKKSIVKEKAGVIILIQPFKDIQPESVVKVAEDIKKVYPKVKVLDAIDFPENTYYKERNRYRADSIIKFLNSKTKEGFVTIGLTSKDISATRGKNKRLWNHGTGL